MDISKIKRTWSEAAGAGHGLAEKSRRSKVKFLPGAGLNTS